MNGKKSAPPENSKFHKLIHDNFSFIEKQCFHAVNMRRRAFSNQNHIDIENEVLELSNRVLDQLTKNGFRVLKRFQNQSRFTTYLNTIIANQAVDLIRKKRGRDRSAERARQFGELGHLIYQKIVIEGQPTERTYQELFSTQALSQSLEEFDLIVEKIRGSRENPGVFLHLENRSTNLEKISDPESGKAIAPGKETNPEEITIRKMQQKKVEEILDLIIKELRGEERLILRMRYPAGEENSLSVETIAKKLGISKKAVYKRINRILNKCQTMLNKMGIDFHDLL
jgi:RNA polymerase sigma factor (sigma-70 family)